MRPADVPAVIAGSKSGVRLAAANAPNPALGPTNGLEYFRIFWNILEYCRWIFLRQTIPQIPATWFYACLLSPPQVQRAG